MTDTKRTSTDRVDSSDTDPSPQPQRYTPIAVDEDDADLLDTVDEKDLYFEDDDDDVDDDESADA